MNPQKYKLAILLCALAMLVVILDSRAAMDGMSSGLELCLNTVIPSLFPLMVLSAYLTANLNGVELRPLSAIGRLCGVPQGAESILLTGLIGGYPIGAQCVTQAYETGHLSRKEARRLMGFCNNAGPAFIFGMCSGLFSSPWSAWCLWLIHILSALLVGVVLPGKTEDEGQRPRKGFMSFSEAVQRGLKTMMLVCGWVVLFRVLIVFCENWFLWLLPRIGQSLFCGILELTNGCCSLYGITEESLRFIMCAFFLGLGGLCVTMQTLSCTATLGMGRYYIGKLLQSLFSGLLAMGVLPLLYPHQASLRMPAFISWTVLVVLSCLFYKKGVAFSRRFRYNIPKPLSRGIRYAVSKEN